MPITGNTFIATLKKTHLGWGTLRYTKTRAIIKNEGYIPIPANYARAFNLTNLHNKKQSNVYKFNTSDGFLTNSELKATGNSKKGDVYAKNLHGNGDLKLLGTWFKHIGAKIGDQIEVKFISSTEILLTKI